MKKINTNNVDISISIVSHGQINLIKQLLIDINQYCHDSSIELILTLNFDEKLPFLTSDFFYPIQILKNLTCQGFAANHNQAFLAATGKYFCVMNPDIRLTDNPFKSLISYFTDSSISLVAPLVINDLGMREDSARSFPTPVTILAKAFGIKKSFDYIIQDKPIYPDWVAGMFMLFPSEMYRKLQGFNQHYFLYYEDVELCARIKLLGHAVLLCPDVKVIHNAQRTSHKDLKYLRWHLTSMIRFFMSRVFWQIIYRKILTGLHGAH